MQPSAQEDLHVQEVPGHRQQCMDKNYWNKINSKILGKNYFKGILHIPFNRKNELKAKLASQCTHAHTHTYI